MLGSQQSEEAPVPLLSLLGLGEVSHSNVSKS